MGNISVHKLPKQIPGWDISGPVGNESYAPYKKAPRKSHKTLKGDRQGSRKMLFQLKTYFI